MGKYIVNYYESGDEISISIDGFNSKEEAEQYVKQFQKQQQEILNTISDKFDRQPEYTPYMKVEKVVDKNMFMKQLNQNALILTGSIEKDLDFLVDGRDYDTKDEKEKLLKELENEWNDIFKDKENLYIDDIFNDKNLIGDKNDLLNLSKFSSKVAEWHTNFSIKDSSKYRGHDKQTPYYSHPIGCAYFIMEDNNGISYNKRLEMAVVMLGHDLKEDTNIVNNGIKLDKEIYEIFGDKNFAKKCNSFIDKCTLAPGLGSMDEYKMLKENQKNIPEEIWYIKLVDKYYNVFGSKEYFIQKGTLDKYLEFLTFLIEQTKQTKTFKQSMFISQAEAMVKELKMLIKVKPQVRQGGMTL